MSAMVPSTHVREGKQSDNKLVPAFDGATHLSRLKDLCTAFGFDFPANQDLVLQYAWEMMQARFVVYHQFDPDRDYVTNRKGYALPADFRSGGRLSGRICHKDLDKGKPCPTVWDKLSDPGVVDCDPDIRRYHIKAYIGHPVILDGRIIGSLGVYCKKWRSFTAADKSVVTILAEVLSFFEERIAVERALQRKLAVEKMLASISAGAIRMQDIDSFRTAAITALGKALAMDQVFFWCHDLQMGQLIHRVTWHARKGCLASQGPLKLTAEQIGELISLADAGEPLAYKDISDLTVPGAAHLLRQQGIKSMILAPMIYQGQLYGFCGCASESRRIWSNEDVNAVTMAVRVIVQAIDNKKVQDRLGESEALNRQMIELSPTGIYRIDLVAQRFLSVNDTMCRATGYSEAELLAMNPADLLVGQSRALFASRLEQIAAGKPVSSSVALKIRTKAGDAEWALLHIRHLYENGRIVGANVVAHLVTDHVENQLELSRYRQMLELLVQDRTRQLTRANDTLRREIAQREKDRGELQLKTEKLEELNTAMRVLLARHNEAHERLETRVNHNLHELVLPYLDRLEGSGLNGRQKKMVEIIRANLSEMVSPPAQEVPSRLLVLTPTELQIVNLIRKGARTKEMAAMMNMSARTVDSYRYSIRRKLGIANRKVNLRSFLLSL